MDEILRFLACELVESEANATAVSLACCCKTFEEPVLDALWGTQDRLTPLLKCFPRGVWKEEDGNFVSQVMESIFPTLSNLTGKSLKRIPTKAEWSVFRKHARRMRKLIVNAFTDPVTSDILFALQLRATNKPLFPKLEFFKCTNPTESLIPFIPSFLSHETTSIYIEFSGGLPTVMVASMIIGLSKPCPNLERITLDVLPRDPVITEAASELLLTCNRDSLRRFCVDSPLTEEANKVAFQLPKLSILWTVIQGHTQIPPVALPNLSTIDVEYDDYLDWLRGFRGAILGRLESVIFESESEQIGDLLGQFKSVALTTSAPATLLTFNFRTSRSWDPDYRSLLPFTQLNILQIDFSCENHCSSKVNDNIIIDLARAMPKLEILRLGGAPCKTIGGVTVKGLVALARGCRHLSSLRIHFQTTSLVEAATGPGAPAPLDDETTVRWGDCVLTDLEVGKIPIHGNTILTVTVTLLQIFPRLYNIKFVEGKWEGVVRNIKLFKRIGAFIRHTGDALDIGDPQEWCLPLFLTRYLGLRLCCGAL